MYQKLLQQLVAEHRAAAKNGKTADYIPILQKVDPHLLACSVILLNGDQYEAGDIERHFTIQSISKVLTFALALKEHGEEKVLNRVGLEPTAAPFNTLKDLEMPGSIKPINPMINAGALTITSLLLNGRTVEETVQFILAFARQLTGNPSLQYSEEVYLSERETAHLNRALAYYLKSRHMLDGDVEQVLEVYFRQCAIEVSCMDLARMGAVFANDGRDLTSSHIIIPASIARLCRVIMVTCGMYNGSGDFAFRVGIPAKSGVAGGIMAVIPRRMGIGIYGPALDAQGNSIAGIKLLEAFIQGQQLSIF